MQAPQTDLLTDPGIDIPEQKRKRLLPWWIKLFMWVFLVLGAFIPFVLLAGILGYSAELALYGLETNEAASLTGAVVTLLYLIKSMTAFGLWKEKHWAVKLGIIDAITGISVCVFIMLYPYIYGEGGFSLRLELILLIPFLVKLLKIKTAWENPAQA